MGKTISGSDLRPLEKINKGKLNSQKIRLVRHFLPFASNF